MSAAGANGRLAAPMGQLEWRLRRGDFVVTCELGPPRGSDPRRISEKARLLRGWVDAANLTDGQGAVVRMSPLAASRLCLEAGLEPVMQLGCRDRNRIALQAEVLGASALGIPNLLCLTGDHQRFGDHPEAKGVFDLDSVQLLWLVRTLKLGTLLNGRPLQGAPRLFVGCVENPVAEPVEYRAARLRKKAAAGAQFCQTQLVYDVAAFARFMADVRRLDLHRRIFILAGVGPIRSARALRFMREHVPGLVVPEAVARRIEGAAPARQAEEGIRLCVEIIEQVRAIEGVAGVHIMAPEWEEVVPEIVARAGLEPRVALEEREVQAVGVE
jgi:methylenetetrahydrofolate reductase (NADPH)